LRTSVAPLAVENVVVPSMGDSITEGTIATISKSAGDAVQEDEVIAQIETDKVTIDVRAPHAGTLAEIMVSADQNVEVGQVIAKLDSEGGGAKAQPSSSQPAKEGGGGGGRGGTVPAQVEPAPRVGGQPMAAERPQPSGSSDSKAPSDGRARMQFPPRRLEDGTRISDLPPAENEQHTARLSGAAAASSGHPPGPPASGTSATTVAEAESEREGVMLRRWAVGAPLPADEDWQPAPGKWALSDREMEMIDLGGADP